MDRYIPHFLITAGIAVCCWAFFDENAGLVFAAGCMLVAFGAGVFLADSDLGEGGE